MGIGIALGGGERDPLTSPARENSPGDPPPPVHRPQTTVSRAGPPTTTPGPPTYAALRSLAAYKSHGGDLGYAGGVVLHKSPAIPPHEPCRRRYPPATESFYRPSRRPRRVRIIYGVYGVWGRLLVGALLRSPGGGYDFTLINGVCYTPTQWNLALQGTLHKRGTQWEIGPGPSYRARRTCIPPPPPRLPAPPIQPTPITATGPGRTPTHTTQPHRPPHLRAHPRYDITRSPSTTGPL